MGCCGGNNDVSDENPHGKAKSYDPKFNGPIRNRSCTDVICCLLFFVYVLAFIVVGLFAWLNGDPVILLNPTDTQGRICGVNYVDLNLSGKEFLFYFDISRCANPATLAGQCPTTQICVQRCPNETWAYIADSISTEGSLVASSNRETVANTVDWTKYICTYGFNPRTQFVNGKSIQAMITDGNCAPYYIEMSPVVKRCIPQVLSDAANFTFQAVQGGGSFTAVNANNETVNGTTLQSGLNPINLYLNAQSVAEEVFADLTVSWYWLLIGFVISALVAFLWIVIMRWIAGVMVWITLLGLIGLLSFGVWYSYDEYNRLLTVRGSDRSILSVGFTTNLSTYLNLQQTWLAFLIILAILDVILILMVLFLRKRILIAVEVIGVASKAIGEIITTLFYPLVTFVLVLVLASFYAATALFLASTGEPLYQYTDVGNASNTSLIGTPCNISAFNRTQFNNSLLCAFEKYGGTSIFHQNAGWLQIFQLFGFLWLLNWILALGQTTLAGAFSSYYWARNKPKDIPLLPLYSSFGRALRYHTGSIAFGSLLIAIIQLIRIILEYIDHKLKGKDNKVVKFILCCCKCCFWCLEKFMKFINRNAYIMIAIYGKNFCWSAKEAFKLLLRNILRVAVLDKVTDFVVFVGKAVVAVGMGALSWAFFTDKFAPISLVAPRLNYYWVLIIIIVLGSYFIAAGFFNTFGMAVDTIFLCVMEDLERNDGSEQKPYFMTKGLMNVFGKKNKKRSKSE